MIGFHTMLSENLEMPFKTQVLGVEVQVEKLDVTDDKQIAGDLHAGRIEPADIDPRPAASEAAA
jgi:hypothetical protein